MIPNLEFMESIAGIYLGEPVQVHIQHMPGKLGLAWIDAGDRRHISLSQSMPDPESLFTFLHEVGHHYHQHITLPDYKTSELSTVLARNEDDPALIARILEVHERKEREADAFADKTLAELTSKHGPDVVNLFWK